VQTHYYGLALSFSFSPFLSRYLFFHPLVAFPPHGGGRNGRRVQGGTMRAHN